MPPYSPEAFERAMITLSKIRMMGAAALDMCMVADGQADAMYEFGLKPWDTAAAGLIAQRAGAVFAECGEAEPPSSHVVSSNPALFDRLCELIDHEKVVVGGQCDAATRYIAPTIMDNVTFDDAVMGEEIFGPLLPIIEYDDEQQMLELLQSRETPLAMYIFSSDKKKIKRYLKTLPSGDAVVNDTLMQIVNPNLPFGGQGNSGVGHYHGRHSINAFSHHRSVVYRNRLLDIPRYAPYARIFKLIRKLI